MRLLHLHWPHLLLRLARSRSASFPPDPTPGSAPPPIILGGQPWTAGVVLDASPAALAMGVRRGMALGSAHRLAPEATFLDPDPIASAVAVEAALDRLTAFSPGVAGETDETHPAFGRLDVQLDGLERLWGPEPILVERMRDALAPILPGPPCAGIAGTRFAAVVAASPAVTTTEEAIAAVARPRPGQAFVAVPPGDEAAFLAPLPAALLTVDEDVRARLARFGLRQIGQVAAVSRSALVARFGAEGERLHARARGEETDPFRPRRMPERMSLALPVEPPVEDLEPLRFLLHRLAATLADQLTARGMATARAHLRLALDVTFAPPGTPVSVD